MRHPESWLQACEDGVRALIRGSFLPAAAAADFPQSFLDLAAFEPLTVSKALRRARKWDGAGCGPLFPPVLAGETLPPASFQCAHCEALFATHQQLSVHEFAAHGVRTTAEDFPGATHCNCCFTQFWTKARLRRHLTHDKPACLRALQDHNLARPSTSTGSDISHRERASLPAFRLQGPVQPLTEYPVSECISHALDWVYDQGDTARSKWHELQSKLPATPAVESMLEGLYESLD